MGQAKNLNTSSSRALKNNFPGYDPKKFVTTVVSFLTRPVDINQDKPIQSQGDNDLLVNLAPFKVSPWHVDSLFTFVTTDNYYTLLKISHETLSIIDSHGLAIWSDCSSRQVAMADSSFETLMRKFTSYPYRLVTYESVEVDIASDPTFLKMN